MEFSHVICIVYVLSPVVKNNTLMYCNKRQLFSFVQVFAVHIFLAYLELLVNSRNELALARVINIPDRKLDHSAFTDIKHEAKKRNLSMYQVCR